jgi:Fe-S cluster biogenesis protein NfuA
MFVQTQKTPNPNSLKFLPGKKVSEDGPYEILNINETNNYLIRNILSINGVTGIFLGEDFLSVNKEKDIDWENIKHIVISHINEYYAEGNESIINNKTNSFDDKNYNEIEKKIISILETKVRPAVARDGGDIKFIEYEDGKVKVELQGSCSGCPSSTLTLKQGVQNLLCHYIPEVKEVLAV